MGSATDDDGLKRLELLRSLKRRAARSDGANESPFADSVDTDATEAASCDVEGIQGEVKAEIEGAIAKVGAGGKSQVVLISGEAGAGKTHLLRQFQKGATALELGYVFVGGSNHWRIDEFTPYLLDRLIAALTVPNAAGDNLLWDRVRAIGFKAVDQILDKPPTFRRCRARTRGGWLRRRFDKFRVNPIDEARRLAVRRDRAVFALLDPARFSEHVCDQFLADSGDPVHRYVLRVLLAPLFTDPADTGMELTERVIHWLRRRRDDGFFTRRIGAQDDLIAEYKAFDAIKLIIHLFAPALSKELSTADSPCDSKVFLLAFDQAEGRNELFDSDADWVTFFAQLSELYNTLSNAVVLFTMTLMLRNRLLPKMERQFKDRIRSDDRFVLRHPTEAEVLTLYRLRLERWVADDADLLAGVRALSEQYLPLGRDGVLSAAGLEAVRLSLRSLDVAFRKELGQNLQDIEPEYDFLFEMNELRSVASLQGEWDFTAEHLKTVRELFDRAGDWLSAEAGLRLGKVEVAQDSGPHIVRFNFDAPQSAGSWACVYLARFGNAIAAHAPRYISLLKNMQKARYTLWTVRPRIFTLAHDNYDGQMFERVANSDLEIRLRGLLHLLRNKDRYEALGVWPAVAKIVRREVGTSYLGELLRGTSERVAAIASGKSGIAADDTDGPAVASEGHR